MKRLFNTRPIAFVRKYKLFSFAVVAAIAGIILDLSGLDPAAHYVLGITSLIATLPLLAGMWDDIRHGTYGIDILAVTAIVTAVLLHEYYAAIVVVLMLTGGESLEDYAEHRARNELDALLSRAPQQAHVVRGRKVMDVPAAQVQVGDRIIIKPGEVVPVDATILEGSASFDESSLTGESVPQSKSAADQLLSGSINLDGAITARATHVAADSQYQQIIKLVRAAAGSQAPFVRLADRYAIPFTIIAFAIAGTVWAVTGEAIRFLEVIIVATPCPLLLAAPIAIISGMSRASRQGIIVKTGSALERLAQTQTIAFDKTGTLTQGMLTVDQIVTYGKFTKVDVIGMAASLEASSTHVLARAINEAAVAKKARVPKAKQIRETSGSGLMATVGGKQVLVGRMELLAQHEVEMPVRFTTKSIKQTATYVAVDGKLAGVLTFKDEIRPHSKTTLDHLKQLGIRHFMMITGDHKAVATSVARQLGIDDVRAETLPADKLHAIESVQNRPLAFVGDGVNDAPVLTASDTGIALGARGSTAASESADIVIMLDDISLVGAAVAIAKRTFRIAKQSILVGIGLSVLLMLVFATGKFKPVYGAAIQELVDVVVIFNALRAHYNGK